MGLTDKIEIPRRVMVLFFVVDTSGSMEGSKLGAVNTAIEEVIPAIKEVSEENADAQIKVAVLEFSSGARWITENGPIEVEQFHWNDLKADGVTDFGDMCKALNEKLSTKDKGFMKEASGSFAPAIFLLSDGEPTDDWKKSLTELKQNNWFRAGVKVAVGIGEDFNMDVLKEFTGNIEAVLKTSNAATLKKMIKFVSVRSSQIASKSSNVSDEGKDLGDEAKQQELVESLNELKEEIAESPDNDQADW